MEKWVYYLKMNQQAELILATTKTTLLERETGFYRDGIFIPPWAFRDTESDGLTLLRYTQQETAPL